jgi:hypothetical protein
LRDNARCTLREVSEVVLQNESGQRYSLCVTPGLELNSSAPATTGLLPLYESVRNDSQSALDMSVVPPYGARRLRANELNSLTKACVSAVGDHNDNGLSCRDPQRLAA